MGFLTWLRDRWPAFLALASATSVLSGVWALFGWPWAAIATGMPGVCFYLWGQIRSATGGPS